MKPHSRGNFFKIYISSEMAAHLLVSIMNRSSPSRNSRLRAYPKQCLAAVGTMKQRSKKLNGTASFSVACWSVPPSSGQTTAGHATDQSNTQFMGGEEGDTRIVAQLRWRSVRTRTFAARASQSGVWEGERIELVLSQLGLFMPVQWGKKLSITHPAGWPIDGRAVRSCPRQPSLPAHSLQNQNHSQ